jgi:hypothetical protein
MTNRDKIEWSRTGNNGGYRSSCGRFEIMAVRSIDTHWNHDVWNLLIDGEWHQDHYRLKDAKRDAQRFTN